MSKAIQHTILLVVFILLNFRLQAQPGETEYYYFKNQPHTFHAIDTGLQNLEEYNFMSSPSWDYFNLGNTGQAHQYTALQWYDKRGFKSGMSAFDQYKYEIDKIRYYQVEKPLSEINYFIGSKRENIFGAKFAHNVKNRFNYGLNFHRVLSNGVYNNIRARNGNFAMYGQFFSKNSRYSLGAEMTFSKVKAEENGGLQADFINTPSLRETNKEFYEINIEDGLTEHQNFNVQFTNTYRLGFSVIDSISDSLSIRKFHSRFTLNHMTGTSKNTFQFVDQNPVDSIYGAFFQPTNGISSDSTYYRMYYHEIPNRIFMEYTGLKQSTDSAEYINLTAQAGIQHDNIEIWQNRAEFTTNNLHAYGHIQSNPLAKKAWSYHLGAYYYFTGYNQNDWQVKGLFAYNFKRLGEVQIHASIEQQEASWIENNYASTSLNWENQFKKKTRMLLAFDYQLAKQKLSFHAEYNSLGNFVYFDEFSTPQQLNNTLSYWQAFMRKDLNFKILHFDNFLGLQGNNRQQALRLPRVFVKSSLYIEGFIFKGKMLGSFGVDLRYNSRFAINAWNPLIGQYHIQNEQTMKFTPVLDVFLSFKVKTLRFFMKANYVNEGLIAKNYFTALGYPDRGRTLAGGLVWRFLE